MVEVAALSIAEVRKLERASREGWMRDENSAKIASSTSSPKAWKFALFQFHFSSVLRMLRFCLHVAHPVHHPRWRNESFSATYQSRTPGPVRNAATPSTAGFIIRPDSSQKRCLQCEKVVRFSTTPLACCGCKRLCHKSCSKLSRGEHDMFIQAGSWRCPNCSVNANNAGTDNNTTRRRAPARKADVRSRDCLRLIQWNANGIKIRMLELADAVRRLNVDIVLIQETKLRALDNNPNIKGYSKVSKDRGIGRGGGLITFIKEDLPFTIIDTPAVENSLLEMLSIELRTKSFNKMLISNVYCPSARGASIGNEFNMSELPSDPNSLTGGDLNAHSNMWDEWQSEDPLGTNLEEWLLAKDFCVANDGSATRTNPGTGGSSAPDVTLVHNNILDRVEWSTINSLGSEHLPVLVIVTAKSHP